MGALLGGLRQRLDGRLLEVAQGHGVGQCWNTVERLCTSLELPACWREEVTMPRFRTRDSRTARLGWRSRRLRSSPNVNNYGWEIGGRMTSISGGHGLKSAFQQWRAKEERDRRTAGVSH